MATAYLPEERNRFKRQRTEQAIQLAMAGRWEEAVAVNRAILELFPTDVDTYNRLGKALTELGHYREAREAYQKGLEIDPSNMIAKKNLARLATLREAEAPVETHRRPAPQMFIEETGKTGFTTLQRPSRESLARLTAGDPVALKRQDNVLAVESPEGEYIGEVEPKLGMRLIKLMDGGNRYEAAITSINNDSAQIIIKEIYQHPSQAGKLSFPPVGTEATRPYIKGGLLRQEEEIEEEELYEEVEEGEWGPGAEEGTARGYLHMVKGEVEEETFEE
ncbi:MAG TPA: tetratricopeptide repeat protein [Dehalococcoidia bacterium]|nr:tetratricopeptide repeat protein [Dehalococcoidia bacterium]